MSENQRCGIAIIGGGMVSETHLRAVADLKDTIELVGVLSRTPESTSKFAENASEIYGASVQPFDDMEAICASAEVDWAIVLTPPNARQEIVSKLAGSGKGILLEKPIERDLKAALEIVETCTNADVPLGVVFQHRARQSSQKLKELIDGGNLGELALVEVSVPWWREQSYYDEPGRGTYARDGGGVLISQAIHTLDLMMSLAGRVTEVQALARTSALHEMEAEDYVTAGLRFENGAAGSLIASTASYPGDAESITLHFTKCVAHLQSGEIHLKWRDGRTEQFGEAAATGGGADPMAFTHEWHRDLIAAFNTAFVTGENSLVSGKEALDVHALIHALVQSSSEKRAIEVPYLDSSK